ncbi:FMRFamide receptor [Brachionus plicatilis]|uniref:FMRFamide receptor n=1 Tax=Brachionus plicatilis TaxID=10195 RepID=A0A3M7QTQ4_BRAPC|nr:FMRFamide receptor [Brachionus plicatilis]
MLNKTTYNNFVWMNNTNLCENNELNIIHPAIEYEEIINGLQGYILWGIIFVIIAFLGLIGNIITIIVLKKEPILTNLNILLIALAISDILAPMANVLLAISFYHLSKPYENSVNFLIFNDILRYFIQPLSTMFTMSSSWILTTTTLFRLIAVMLPFRARSIISKRFAMVCLFLIFGLGLISILPLYANLIRKFKCTRDNTAKYVAFDMTSSEFMGKYYVPIIQTLCFYLPWCLALILWFFLLKALKKSEKSFNFSFSSKDSPGNSKLIKSSFNNHNILGNSSNPENSSIHSHTPVPNSRINNVKTRQKSYNRITLMVVVLTFTNLFCRLFTFVFIFEVIYNQYLKSKYLPDDYEINDVPTQNDTDYQPFNYMILNSKFHFPKFLAYSLLLNNIFLCINHSCNIVIYTITNPRFRRHLMDLFGITDPGKNKKVTHLHERNSLIANRNTIIHSEFCHFNNRVNTSVERQINKRLFNLRNFVECFCHCCKYGHVKNSAI